MLVMVLTIKGVMAIMSNSMGDTHTKSVMSYVKMK